jgi:hypothetical protein
MENLKRRQTYFEWGVNIRSDFAEIVYELVDSVGVTQNMMTFWAFVYDVMNSFVQ